MIGYCAADQNYFRLYFDSWQARKLTWNKVLAEQQFKDKNKTLEPWCCWVTAGTSQHYTAQQKLEMLNHYVKESQR